MTSRATLQEDNGSRYEIAAEEPLSGTGAEIVCEPTDRKTGRALPVRVVVTAADGSHPDGAGHGLYADGRFFSEGAFTVKVPPGATEVVLRSGPNYVPLTIRLTATAGRRIRLRAQLLQWFSPEERGWYSGESHVHTKHDRTGAIQMDGRYTALQARAQGLSFLSQASKGSADEDPTPLSTPDFIFRNAAELGGGPFVGHFTTPGISEPVLGPASDRAFGGPLPVQNLIAAVHERGGILTYTHPLAPPHLLHWMGATESYSDGVLRRTADAFDLDSRGTEMVWFGLLNLGNRLAASSYTDSALERPNTLAPGDRRVYSHAGKLAYPAIIAGLRAGRTFATNGGPVFPFFTVSGHEPGDTLTPKAGGQSYTAQAELHSLYPLKSAELYRRGAVAHAFPVTGQKGKVTLSHTFSEAERSWYVLRVEDERGNWAITSPVYFEPSPAAPTSRGSVAMLEISNHIRYTELRRDFFAHLLVTVSPEERLTEVRLMREGQLVQRFQPKEGNNARPGGQTPVNGDAGEYQPGWLWYPNTERAVHLQADVPVKETGWYHVEASTAAGKTIRTDAVRFDAAQPTSHASAVLHLRGEDFQLTRWGYGEEMPLQDIRLPFDGDHWWYPNAIFWRLSATFGSEKRQVGGGDEKTVNERFRPQ